MDFFDHQEAAHRRSGWIRWLFVLAIVSACAAMCLIVFVVYAAMSLVATWGTGDAVPNRGTTGFSPSHSGSRNCSRGPAVRRRCSS
jgi:hypothetical protein